MTLIASSKHDQKNLEDALETIRRMLERVDASVQVDHSIYEGLILLDLNKYDCI